MDFTIALKKREIEQATALQARQQLLDISLYESEAAGAGPPRSAVEPVRLSAELGSELGHRRFDQSVHLAVTLQGGLRTTS